MNTRVEVRIRKRLESSRIWTFAVVHAKKEVIKVEKYFGPWFGFTHFLKCFPMTDTRVSILAILVNSQLLFFDSWENLKFGERIKAWLEIGMPIPFFSLRVAYSQILSFGWSKYRVTYIPIWSVFGAAFI